MDLTNLWQRRIRTILNAAAEGETDHREISNLSAHIEADYHGRFLVELLQNAEDQAVAADLGRSRVAIIRARELIAVSNEGLPFNEKGVKAITSAGISPKDANVSIGNKGVGFKAVFQISDGPEIYSSKSAETNFLVPGGARFKLALTPFQDPNLRSVVDKVVNERRSRELGDPSIGTCCPDAFSAALDELQTAAPFKFPLPLSQSDLDQRLAEAELPPGVAETAQTLVVLPLKDNPATQMVVNRALDEICAKAGTVLLFLSAVDRVEIVDLCRNQNIEIVRERDSDQEYLLQCHADFCSVRTHVTRDEESVLETEEESVLETESAEFFVISRFMGRDGSSPAAADERQEFADATRELPGDSWKNFDSAFVQVAIPRPNFDEGQLVSPATSGHFFIGLPTRDETGSCASLSAPFHGTISRTGLDLKDQPLNRILFREAVNLFWAGIERLKADKRVEVRRFVSLLFGLGSGALAREIVREVSVDQADVVLSADGHTFIPACDLMLPPPSAEKGAFDVLDVGPAELEARGFKLADFVLVRQARGVLADLAGGEKALEAPKELYLKRQPGQSSLLEHIARSNRYAGQWFWREFFDWVIASFGPQALDDQEILPVVGGGLASSRARVFLSPLVKAEGEILEDDEQVAGEIPNEIRSSLRFLDENAIPAREPERANVRTELARRLAPDAQSGLVRRPRSYDLINDALAPRLQAAADKPKERALALSLLLQAGKWIDATGESNLSRVRKRELRVPVQGDDGEWAWASPTTAYFGKGWLDESRERMLSKAYEKTPERRLVPWLDFQESLNETNVDLNAWVAVMEAVGVHSAPRLLTADRRRSAPLRCVKSYTLASVDGVECPILAAKSYWSEYLSSIKKGRQTATCSDQRYDVKDLCWIEGLEDPDGRAAVFEMVLMTPDRFSTHRETALARRDGGSDQTIVPTMWVQAIRGSQWKIVPTNTGPCSPDSAWLLSSDEINREYALHNLISFVPLRYSTAAPILQAIGVSKFDDAPIARLIRELHSVASKIEGARTDNTRPLLSLSRELYGRLNDRCEEHSLVDGDAPLSSLLEHPVPVLRGRSLVAADLRDTHILYLNDDQSRSRLIEGFSNSLSVPLAARAASKALTRQLTALLGEERVRRTSHTPIETGFVPDGDRTSRPLLDVFGEHFVGVDVASDLLALYCFGRPGVRSVSPTGDEFGRTWALLQQTTVLYGKFRDGISHRAAFDQFATNGPTLQISDAASGIELMEACWPIFGGGCRDLIAAYARLVNDGEVGEFLSDRDVGASERDQISAVIGRKDEYLLERLKPLLLALWLRGASQGDVAAFEERWLASKRDKEGVGRWLDIPELDRLLAHTAASEGEQGVLEVLNLSQVTVAEWQSARELLGQPLFEFDSTTEEFERVKYRVLGVLKVHAARDANADLAGLQPLLEELAGLGCPTDARCRPLGYEAIVSCVSELFGTVLSRADATSDVTEMQALLERSSLGLPMEAARVKEVGVPLRDLAEYLDKSETMRTASACEMLSAILNVAVELAGEMVELDVKAIRGQVRIASLSSGWWANRYSLLLPLRNEVRRVAPHVAGRLTEVRAFRDPCGELELRARLPEIQPTVIVGGSADKKPKEVVPGLAGFSNEIDEDLSKGSGGAVGEALRGAAGEPVDFFALATSDRKSVSDGLRKQRRQRSGSRGGGGADPAVNERNGLLGEAFVYEVLRIQLRGFDSSNWVSSNRRRYGLEAEGDDDLGYDFQYRDVDGKLTGKAEGPLCYIEVKSTSGDGNEPFPISSGEWRLAEECHLGKGDPIYIIVRVAGVRDHPSLVDVIVDPIRLWHDGLLGLDRKDLWVRLGY